MLSKLHKSLILSVAVLFMGSAVASAAPVITVGNHALQPDLTDQTIDIMVHSTEPIDVLNFLLYIGDGGEVVGGTDFGPVITDIDLTVDVYSENALPQGFVLESPMMWITNILGEQGETMPVSPEGGILARVTIDTTGLLPGQSWLLGVVGHPVAGDTTIDQQVPEAPHGTLSIIPEPASASLLGLLGLAMLRRRRRAQHA